MPPILLAHMPHGPVSHQPMELVKRKGLGYPDSLCDAMMEAIAVVLSQAYIAMAGHVLHHNLDKGLLVAGQSSPALGGGTVDTPMRLIVGDRATTAWRGQPIPVREIAEATAKRWLTEHLRFVDPDRHVVFQHELQPGAPELVALFAREHLGANDTSAAVGYAPLTETERCVLAAERWLNGPACKARFPDAGEDMKVMGYRQGRQLTLTIALALPTEPPPPISPKRSPQMGISRLPWAGTTLRPSIYAAISVTGKRPPRRWARRVRSAGACGGPGRWGHRRVLSRHGTRCSSGQSIAAPRSPSLPEWAVAAALPRGPSPGGSTMRLSH